MNIHSDTLNPFHACKIDVSETGDNSVNPDLVSDIEDKKSHIVVCWKFYPSDKRAQLCNSDVHNLIISYTFVNLISWTWISCTNRASFQRLDVR